MNPKKRYYASPDVPEGEVSQTTFGEKGFSVTVSRTVNGEDGKVLHDDSFPSRYIPEDAIYLIGKGGKLPAGQTLSGLYPGYTGSTAGIDLDNWLATKKPPKKKRPPTARCRRTAPSPAPTARPGRPRTRHRRTRRTAEHDAG